VEWTCFRCKAGEKTKEGGMEWGDEVRTSKKSRRRGKKSGRTANDFKKKLGKKTTGSVGQEALPPGGEEENKKNVRRNDLWGFPGSKKKPRDSEKVHERAQQRKCVLTGTGMWE